jgi:hypothetical protein
MPTLRKKKELLANTKAKFFAAHLILSYTCPAYPVSRKMKGVLGCKLPIKF